MRRLLFLLVLLLLAGCAEVAPGDYYLIPAQDITPDYQHCEGADCWRVQLITQTPVPTLSFPTPTPEATLLPTIPATSIPKPSPPPDPGRCSVLVVADPRLNVRATPGGAILGTVLKGDILAPEGYWTVTGVKWYQIYWEPGVVGYIHSSYTAPLTNCSRLPDVSPSSPAAWLIHVVPGYNVMELNATYPLLASAGVPFGIKTYSGAERCEETLLYGGICIFRIPLFGSDCPDMGPTVDNDPFQSARAWMAEYKRHTLPLWKYSSTGRFFLELTNECRFGDESDPKVVHWWRNWLNTAADIALAENFPPAVVPTFGPGYGDTQWMYEQWREGLNKFASRGGLIGWHDYTPNYPPTPVIGLCVCDEWLGCRHRRNYQALRAAGVNMGYTITEVARGWGGETVDVGDFVCWYGKIKNDPGLHSVAAWTGGFQNDPRWGPASLDGHYYSLAVGVTESVKRTVVVTDRIRTFLDVFRADDAR